MFWGNWAFYKFLFKKKEKDFNRNKYLCNLETDDFTACMKMVFFIVYIG